MSGSGSGPLAVEKVLEAFLEPTFSVRIVAAVREA